MSESQKQELERHQATVKRQEEELVEARQQLAKLSEIVDRQTDDMKQLNVEARSAQCSPCTAIIATGSSDFGLQIVTAKRSRNVLYFI